MQFTQEQKAEIAAWVEDGASLAEVQRRIRGEFGVQLTYMEVRLLVLDIGATPKEKAAEGGGRSPSAPQGTRQLPRQCRPMRQYPRIASWLTALS